MEREVESFLLPLAAYLHNVEFVCTKPMHIHAAFVVCMYAIWHPAKCMVPYVEKAYERNACS